MLALLLWLLVAVAVPLWMARVVGRTADSYPLVPRDAPMMRTTVSARPGAAA